MPCEGVNFNPDQMSESNNRIWEHRDFENELQQAQGNTNTQPGSANTNGVAPEVTETAEGLSVLDGAVTVTGSDAERVANRIAELYEQSPTFAAAIDQMVANGQTIQLEATTNSGNGSNGWAYLGGGDAFINMSENADLETLDAFIFHELGAHGALGLDHGAELDSAAAAMEGEVTYA